MTSIVRNRRPVQDRGFRVGWQLRLRNRVRLVKAYLRDAEGRIISDEVPCEVWMDEEGHAIVTRNTTLTFEFTEPTYVEEIAFDADPAENVFAAAPICLYCDATLSVDLKSLAWPR